MTQIRRPNKGKWKYWRRDIATGAVLSMMATAMAISQSGVASATTATMSMDWARAICGSAAVYGHNLQGSGLPPDNALVVDGVFANGAHGGVHYQEGITSFGDTYPNEVTPVFNATDSVTSPDSGGTITFSVYDTNSPPNLITTFGPFTVDPCDHLPVAADDSASTTEGTASAEIPVLNNDTDADPSTTLTVGTLLSPNNGTAVVNPDNTITYTPFAGFVGTDTFQYYPNDGLWDSNNAATVTVTVNPPPNSPPTANAGPDVSGLTNSAIQLNGTVGDTDGDTVAANWTTDGASCSFGNASQASTTITCTSPGTYTATLAANDGTNPSVSDSATVTVSSPPPPNHAPTISNCSNVVLNPNVAGALQCTISDPDGDTTTTHWSINSSACPIPNPDQMPASVSCSTVGVYTATVTATDSHSASSSASVTVGVRYPPVPEVTRVIRPLPHKANGLLGLDCLNNNDGIGPDQDVLTFQGTPQPVATAQDGNVTAEADFGSLPAGTYTFSCAQQGGQTVSKTVTLATYPVVHFTAACAKYVMTKGIYKGKAKCKLNNYWSGTGVTTYVKDGYGRLHKYVLAMFQVKTVYIPTPKGTHKVWVYRLTSGVKKLVYYRYVVRLV